MTADCQARYSPADILTTRDANIVEGQLVFVPKRNHPTYSLSTWLQNRAFYRITFLQTFPHCYPEVAHYQQFISRLDRRYFWLAVLTYTSCFWSKCMAYKGPLNIVNHTLFITILDTTSFKLATHICFQYQANNHEVATCPFHSYALLERVESQKKAAWVRQAI